MKDDLSYPFFLYIRKKDIRYEKVNNWFGFISEWVC
jgi:hypothetical protein